MKTRSLMALCIVLSGCPTTPAPTDAGVATDAPGDGGGDDAPSDAATISDAPTPATAADFVEALASAACEAAYACSIADLEFSQVHGTQGQCRARFVDRHGELASDPSIRFDPAMAVSCLGAFDESVCERRDIPDVREWPAACRAALRGTVPVGSACDSTAQCTEGLCTCDGICTREASLGQDCTAATCAPGLRCMSPGMCALDTSVLPREGEPCAALGCFGGLRCSDGVCREARALRRAEIGQPCQNPFELPADVDPEVWCSTGLFCDYDAGSVCAPNPVAGATCTGQGVCEGETVCIPSPARCAPMAEVGDDCFSPHACAPGLVCSVSICEEMRDLGETCTTSEECRSGHCEYVDAVGTCGRLEHAGCS